MLSLLLWYNFTVHGVHTWMSTYTPGQLESTHPIDWYAILQS